MKLKIGDKVTLSLARIKWNLSDESARCHMRPGGQYDDTYDTTVQVSLLSNMVPVVGRVTCFGFDCFGVEFKFGREKHFSYYDGNQLTKVK